jgi:para-nitrobenzyl esterase
VTLKGALAASAFFLFAEVAAPSMIIETSQGTLIGAAAQAEPSINVFKGIPYAVPPVGNRRWKPPEAAAGWAGERLATEFAPDCMQSVYAEDSFYYRPARITSEDCLYLNVWTPTAAGEKLPVIVWIHGGALTRGSAAIDFYDGSKLAMKGAVVVSLNYRLGVFGFFAHPDLIAESAHGAAGNYGVLDQIQGLHWVREHIAAFGGDPDNVTIFGQSAGAWSVSVLSASPLAKGLFHKAIGDSGGRLDRRPELATAASAGEDLARAIGVTALADLRDMSADALLAASQKAGFLTHDIVDGWVLTEQPYETFAAGKHNRVPVLLGFNTDESTTLNAAALVPPNERVYKTNVRRLYSDLTDEYLSIYPAENMYQSTLEAFRDYWFGWQAIAWAQMARAAGDDAYVYRFGHSPPGPQRQELGAYHAAELAFVFNNVYLFGSEATPVDIALADAMSSFWVAFARSGVPAVNGQPAWPVFTREGKQFMSFAAVVEAGQGLFEDRFTLWDQIMGALRPE